MNNDIVTLSGSATEATIAETVSFILFLFK